MINEIATVNGFRSSLAESLGLLAGRISRGVLARAPLPASDMVNYTVETVFTYGHERGGGVVGDGGLSRRNSLRKLYQDF